MNRPSRALALLGSIVRDRARDVVALSAWSIVEAVPAYLSGRLVAMAIDRGFLVGRPATGIWWLGLLGATTLSERGRPGRRTSGWPLWSSRSETSSPP